MAYFSPIKLATGWYQRDFISQTVQSKRRMCAQDFTKNPITLLSRLNWNVCDCMQNLIYDEAVEL